MLEGKPAAPQKPRSRILRAVGRERNHDWARLVLFGANARQTAYCTHLILAALLFSPFLLFGQVLAANTDLLLENYPMLLLAKHNVWHGSLGLWNPYSFSGIPQAAEANTPLFFPENWVLFLIPERFLFPAITFAAFVKVWFVGIAAYRFYCAELLNRRWALFASIAVQLCGMTLWYMGAYVALSIEFYLFVLLALFWTLKQRSILADYLLSSITATLLLMAGDLVYAAYALLGAGILVSYRALSRPNAKQAIQQLTLFTAICATALSIFCVRLLPIVAMMRTSAVVEGCCKSEFTSSSFLLARYFDTEIFGVSFTDSMKFFTDISPAFRNYHLHWVAPQFFGIATIFLALWQLGADKSIKSLFWSVYVIVILASITFIQPFDTIVRSVLLSPITHIMSMQGMLLPGIPALAAFGGMSLERNARRGRISRLTTEFFLFFIVIMTMFIIMIMIRNVPSFAVIGSNRARFLVVVLMISAAASAWLYRHRPKLILASFLAGVIVFSLIALFVVLFWDDDNRTFLLYLKSISVQILLFCVLFVGLALVTHGRGDIARQYGLPIAMAIVAICLFAILYPWTNQLQQPVPHGKGVILASLGAFRFLLGAVVFFFILGAANAKRLPRGAAYLTLISLLLAEQVPADKIHSHIAANPFYSGTLYPPLGQLLDLENNAVNLANFRVNYPITLLQLPVNREIFGPANEVCGSDNVAYGVRSYGGYTDIIPSRTVRLIQNWTTRPRAMTLGIYADETDSRLLDLLAVGYRYEAKTGTIVRRASALARFMLFSNFQVVSDDETALGQLKASTFDPLHTVLLNADPGFTSRSSGAGMLSYKDVNSDRAELDVTAGVPSLVLFDDSYDPGWNATVNGRPQRVLRANYNFMAVPISTGESHIVLAYWPRAFAIGGLCAIAGLIALALAFALFVFRIVQSKRTLAVVL
jgi:Bacterial membrane protein YfhO